MNRVYVVSQAGYSKKYGISAGPVWVSQTKEEAINNYNLVIDTALRVDKDHGGDGKCVVTEVPYVGFGKECRGKFSSGEYFIVSVRECWME